MNLFNFRQIVATGALIWSTQASALHIMLDPGHGGVDTGAVHGAAKEADLVLKVAQRLKKLLEKDTQFQVTLTRAQDRNISLPARVKMAETAKADLFVSLHANAASDQRAKGVEFFFQNNLPPDEESLFLASQENQMILNNKEIHDISGGDELSKKGDIAAILEDLHRQNRMVSSLRLTQTLTHVWNNDENASQATIKQAPFYVISKTSMPSVLIEIGFLTNPREAKKLLTTDYQNDLAQKIYSALLSYKEKIDNHTAKTLN
ncbi:N-acetylmuramoyl-L-alanine amidase [Bdellovibrio bacteriovorus]|uniref:N-acetylmuramoyl-L-alanine amidase family protein n=1 Tax=Bdellovibrio bacteriovorus TaxID=959 RepID=UPI0035A93D53